MARYRFDQIAINSTDKRKPEDKDQADYIGLEHLDSGSLKVTRWGSKVPLKGEKLVMKKGDVLFGKRNAYLRRAAISPHDGLFSAHGMVLRPKTEIVDPEFFPFFIGSDYFFDRAIKISVGSLSPTVNWRDLKKEEFDLPSIPEQKKLTKVLRAISITKYAYEDLVRQTDELVKSQFIEMFGNPEENDKGWEVCSLKDILLLLRNGINVKQDKDQQGIPITRIETISNREVDRSKMGYAGITDKEKYRDYFLRDNDILMSHINSIQHIGKTAIFHPQYCGETIIHGMNLLCLRADSSKVLPEYLFRYFQLDYFYKQVLSITKPAVNQASMTVTDLKNLSLIVPPIEKQEMYCKFCDQSDKSKFELNEAIKDLDAMYKRIIKDNLG